MFNGYVSWESCCRMKRNRVKAMYSMFRAGWYDPFQKIWGSSQGEDAFAKRLRALSTEKTRILDLGCGTGANLEKMGKYKIPYKEYTGMDLTHAMLGRARRKFPYAHFVLGNAEDAKGTYDLIISTWMFEHLTPDERKNILAMPGHHLHMYLGGRTHYSWWQRLFAKCFQFEYVNDKELKGKKTHYGMLITILEATS